MDKIAVVLPKVLASASAPSQQNSQRAVAQTISYHAGNVPDVFVKRADLEIPNSVWVDWIPKGGGSRAIWRPLKPEERSALEARAAELRPALAPYARPFEDDRVAQALADLFSGFRSMREQGADALGLIDSAMRALAPFPAWAIEQACLVIRRDGYLVQDREGRWRTERHWPPSDPQICLVIGEVMKCHRAALASAEALLCAPIEPPVTPKRFQHDWHVWAWLRQAGLPDGKHTSRVMADIEARRAQRAADAENRA